MKDRKLIIEPSFISYEEHPSFYVMMDWEDPLMKEHAMVVTQNGGDILEIGFGLGISANYIQSRDVTSHTIVEMHPEVAKRAREWAKDKPNVTIIEGSWYDKIEKVLSKRYDGIFYDAHEDPHVSKFYDMVVVPSIKDDGIYTYFNPCEYDVFGFGENFRTKRIKVDPPLNNYYNKKWAHVSWAINGAKKVKTERTHSPTKTVQEKLLEENEKRFGKNKILYDKNGIKVEDRNGIRFLEINGLVQLGYHLFRTRYDVRTLEPMSHFRDYPIEVLNIGLGGGRISNGILKRENVVSLDIVEVDKNLLEILKYFDNDNILEDERVNMVFMDVFEFIEVSQKKYDFIFIDIVNSQVSSEENLFSRSFFEKIEKLLKKQGIGVYWYYNYLSSMKNKVDLYIKNMKSSFKNVSYHKVTPFDALGTYFFFSNKYEWQTNEIKI